MLHKIFPNKQNNLVLLQYNFFLLKYYWKCIACHETLTTEKQMLERHRQINVWKSLVTVVFPTPLEQAAVQNFTAAPLTCQQVFILLICCNFHAFDFTQVHPSLHLSLVNCCAPGSSFSQSMNDPKVWWGF